MICPLADSYVSGAAHKAGATAEVAATRKEAKYAGCLFEPIAVETLGPLNSSARLLMNDLGKKISCMSGEARATGFLFQRISVLVQRFNAVLLRNGLPAVDSTD